MQHSPAFLKLVADAMPDVRELGIEQLCQLQQELAPFLLIDVREESEWAAGRIPGAFHLGRGIIERDIETTVPDKAAHIVLYCGGGYRSALAAVSLQKMGYSKVFSLAGGWRAWKEAGLPQAT
jgi:rhodanese-related sulfurtransferase